MTIARPSIEKIQDIGESVFMDISVEGAESFQALLENNLAIYEVLDSLPEDLPPVKYPRTPARSPWRRLTPTTPGIGKQIFPARLPARLRANGLFSKIISWSRVYQ